MKKIIISIIFFVLCIYIKAQNIGLGTTNPTHTLHIVVDPTNPNQDPVRIEGLQQSNAADTVFLVTDPTQGLVQYITKNDLINSLGVVNSDEQNIDSVTLNGNILTVYIENGNSANVDLSNLISNDNQNIDSLTLISTVLTTFIEDGNFANVDLIDLATDSNFYSTIRDSLLADSLFTSSLDSIVLSDSNFTNGLIDTLLSNSFFKDSLAIYTRDTLLSDNYFTDSLFTIIRDSLLGDISTLDSIYSFTSDSLLNDTAWLNQLRDSINTDDQNIDSIVVNESVNNQYQDSLIIYIEDGNSASETLNYTKIDKPQLGDGDYRYGAALSYGKFNKYVGVASYTEYLSETNPLHIRLSNLTVANTNNIYWFEIRGFIRASSDNQDVRNKMIHSIISFGADASSIGGLIVHDYAAPTSFSVYIGTDGYKYLKMTSDASLQRFISIDTYLISTGTMTHGDLEIIPSATDF